MAGMSAEGRSFPFDLGLKAVGGHACESASNFDPSNRAPLSTAQIDRQLNWLATDRWNQNWTPIGGQTACRFTSVSLHPAALRVSGPIDPATRLKVSLCRNFLLHQPRSSDSFCRRKL
jgi:hypothetical protein